MAVVVLLSEVVEAIEMLMEESEAYLDSETGEIVTVTEDDRMLVEGDGPLEELPAWQRESLPKIRDALESGRFLRPPTKFDVHEWDIMRRFSEAQENERTRRELTDAIHGSGAFRMFKSIIRRLGIEDAWYQFRQGALEEIARDWLDEHRLRYK